MRWISLGVLVAAGVVLAIVLAAWGAITLLLYAQFRRRKWL